MLIDQTERTKPVLVTDPTTTRTPRTAKPTPSS
jgi:hypothetical protein